MPRKPDPDRLPHPGRTSAERRALDRIGCGEPPGCSPKTLRRLLDDVGILSRRLGEQDAEKYLMACARSHDAVAALGDPAGVEAALRDAMGLGEGTAEEVLARSLADDELDRIAAALPEPAGQRYTEEMMRSIGR